MARALMFILTLALAAAPRAGSALPTVAPAAATRNHDASQASQSMIGLTRESAPDAAEIASSDSASITDASPSGLYAPTLGGFALEGHRSRAPYIVAGLAIGAVAAPALLFGGERHHGNPATGLSAGFRSFPEPVHVPSPGDGSTDPPALDVTPVTQGAGPEGPSTAPAVPEPPVGTLLAVGLIALGAAVTRSR